MFGILVPAVFLVGSSALAFAAITTLWKSGSPGLPGNIITGRDYPQRPL